MTDKERKAIEELKSLKNIYSYIVTYEKEYLLQCVETVLNLVETQAKELEKKDKMINNSINEIEKTRQYFSEDLQVEFIRILEILKDKKVIDW